MQEGSKTNRYEEGRWLPPTDGIQRGDNFTETESLILELRAALSTQAFTAKFNTSIPDTERENIKSFVHTSVQQIAPHSAQSTDFTRKQVRELLDDCQMCGIFSPEEVRQQRVKLLGEHERNTKEYGRERNEGLEI